ncbi:hypothetical protein CC86DRAFT_365059 [Ophiobolus disseminans]|uniref:Luciferase domain-containing protein n=1 Tax=Ophiobolus disseminans TaxID=1469910 RepID=A0A6A7AJD3_9PLEO|nr:hypothetical protein CC86DRAFT_365059 [Ophiobolus disseminans]
MYSTTAGMPYYVKAMLSETTFHILTTVLTFVLPPLLALYIHKDYKAYISLGPGGTPSTPLGYLKIKLLSIICLRDPLRPLPIPPHFRPQKGYFDNGALPARKGTRPLVQGVAPQRQQSQKSNEAIYKNLVSRLQSLAEDPRNRLLERTSCFEKNSSGLFTSMPITRTCGGEICHAHPSDGSMHLTLHPADAKLMLENGWGERHPLARGGWCRRFVPKEFVLIYAPRDEAEVNVVMKIVAASIWWVSGIDVNGDEQGPRRKSRDVEAVGRAMEGKECWACKAHGCGTGAVEKMTGDA